ncbi:MAG: 50S ribosomal protein L6 [Parcubacteria group bacterium GW2011_GWA1_50_14]|uniref:Large ribosomal subunit protein uL6 n=1 Tax=Candidatus Liptonbacteria bacterium GWB1_49_6 TaxID=1798644 RepID=A0A1G2C692_9BACT|nr:MAG: 50S ribosomal protein L6 [Parcubacteria group bacterium GW2011_GWA1_50_14]OGY96934.1 MAG: 50S ribosomal protein L6 [Candidatus Liptonbacteria bacterium GWB1_49_6]
MSRLSRKPIQIPEGVTVSVDGLLISVRGPKGEKTLPLLPFITVHSDSGAVTVQSEHHMTQANINTGTMWSLVRNAIQGVSSGFSKNLEIMGVGYRAAMEGGTLVLSLGFVNPIRFTPPEGVSVIVEKNVIRISGVDKEKVGQAAAEIRAFKKPEPYKGKGIRYEGEIVQRKAGKKAATAGAGG